MLWFYLDALRSVTLLLWIIFASGLMDQLSVPTAVGRMPVPVPWDLIRSHACPCAMGSHCTLGYRSVCLAMEILF